MRTKIPAIGLALTTALVLAGCSASTTPDSGTAPEAKTGFLASADTALPTGGALTVAVDYDSVEAAGLDPQLADTARSWMILGLSYETLVGLDENFAPTPGLAESWEEKSPTEYVFTLREGATFSNGRAVTPDDVAGSFERLKTIGGAWSAQASVISSVEATGDREVTLHLSKAYSPLFGLLAHVATSVLPIAEIDAGEIDLKTDVVGSGPYTPTAHVQDQSWTFERNTHYNGTEYSPDTITLDVVPDEAARLAAIRDGSADYVIFNNPDAASLLAQTAAATVVNQQNTDFFYLVLNGADPDSPLADERVRFAINAIVDRQQISDVALAGNAKPTALTPFALPDACDPAELPSATISDDEIRDLLSDAGAENLSLTLKTWNSEAGPGAIAQVIQQQLAAFDIDLDVQILDDGIWGEALYGDPAVPADADLSISWFAGYGDASLVTNWWNTDTAGFTARFMAPTPEINTLITEAAETPIGAERADVFTELCAAVDENAQMVALVNRPGQIAFRSDALSPTISTNEGYGNVLRFASDFRLIEAE
ncbi:MAG: ABC transporter substrate-binding protein [Candidatus Microbacterium colombiense]|nr:MAG: ABC transporter substrate-binding protein [Microbacterium sp.]